MRMDGGPAPLPGAERSGATPEASRDVDLSRVRCVLVGFASSMLPYLAELGEGSVLFVEEPDVARIRRADERARAVPAVAGVVEVASQNESDLLWTRQLTRPRDVIAVIPAVEYGVVGAAALAEHWGLPGAGLAAACTLRDKARLRKVAGEAGIPQPDWSLVQDPAELAQFRATHGGHCVLKPTDRQGSLGVRLIGPDDDVTDVWQATIEVRESRLRTERLASPARWLAEGLLDGPEFSVEALVHNGHVIFSNVTGKQVAPGPYPVEIGHVVPALISADLRARLDAATAQLVNAVGFVTGVVHAEWICPSLVPHLVECAGRLPGDGIAVLIDLAYGGRLGRDLLTLLAGRALARPDRATGGAAVQFLLPAPGVVTAVDGIERARQLPGVQGIDLNLRPGDVVVPMRSSTDRVGSVLATGPDAGTAQRRAADAAAAIRITTEAR
jgi:biotin carboxylase